ncbi:MAG: hypothetical protein IPG03_10460 [Candidatus Microthrix sp.]|nr:hypothetical protein [Candidatus Microthrix sp.]MBK6502763.1 hypothetical protein [Candidatus Microthrix sp.]
MAVDRAPNLVVEATPRPRDQVFGWTSEFGDRGTDPEHGPGWRIGVLSLTDGGSAVALAIPTRLVMAWCVLQAITDAVEGRVRRPAYPKRRARRRSRLLWADLAAFVRPARRAACRGRRHAGRQAQAAPKASGKAPIVPAAAAPLASEPTSGTFACPSRASG